MLKCTPIKFSYDSNSNSSVSSQCRMPEYSPLSVKHQMYYQQNIKIDFDPNNHDHDEEITQRTERCKTSQIKNSIIPEQTNSLNNEDADISFHNTSDQQQQHKQPILQERLTHRQSIPPQPQDNINYQKKCAGLEIQLERQTEKVSQLLQYQQEILEQLEETTFTVQKMMQQNQKLSQQLEESDSQLMQAQKVFQEQISQLKSKLDQSEQKHLQYKKMIIQLENDSKIKIKELLQYKEVNENSKEKKFAQCVKQMIQVCLPPGGEEISFKQAWKWLKAVLDEYMTLKKADLNNRVMKDSRPQSEMRFSSTQNGLKKSDIKSDAIGSYQTKSKERNVQPPDNSIHVGQFIRCNRSQKSHTESDRNSNVFGKENFTNQ